jgi:GT2 family glycosyltransferase
LLLDLQKRWRRGRARPVAETVDIVIPVYRGLAETRTCIESVLAGGGEVPAEIVVIDDMSPEAELSAWLRSLAAKRQITLRAHDENRGFVWSANEGMTLHADRDVVLLNSDTEVAPGWLDRLSACVRRDPAIGTATPFSTNATICSYPLNLAANELPPDETTADLDAAFAAANAGRSADIPTAVGFCMYVTRHCIDRVGTFDHERYGAGYGEEVDFCMRAQRFAFRNVVAADVFVRHVGEVSFQGSGLERREKAQATVDALYPEFQEMLRTFIPADPLRGLRRRADLQRLRGRGDQLLREPRGNVTKLWWPRPNEEFALWLDAPALAAVEECLADPAAPLPEIDARPPTVFIQPNTCSTSLRLRWLTASPACRVVRPSIAPPASFAATCGVTPSARTASTKGRWS